jgi:SAM-dependent methyltransferase
MADFNRHADSYVDGVQRSISFSGQSLDYFTRRKADHILELSARLLGDPKKLSVVDVGCGIGVTDELLAGHFGQLHGVDVAGDALTRARDRNPGVDYRSYDGENLPFPTGSVDLAFAICVVHHVEPDRRVAFAAELARVVRPGGLVVVFEHNPLNPLTRVAVSRCEFDEGVVLIGHRGLTRLLAGAGLEPVEARHVIFTPFDRPALHRIERRLHRVPLGAQHYVAARR